ncbi:DNRLRE domain-containing protein [Streptomyces fulvoviolaceus]|uniref:DNRLRE domain-containing protein n=1 Tax=Streptomyces fulvoviolaceus TaxID=285535 RepID=UPI0021BE5B42|nr:DNRLRE domain-containing protein [Streptomyces fulvoviolaceus]MCT9078514.1 DNRLRE domain-containing protein [Streptomyces fulvoviolaceus]
MAAGILPFVDGPGGESSGTGAAKRDTKASATPLTEDTAQAEARRTGKRVEVTGLRTATTTTYALPDGRFEYQAHSAAIRAKVDGQWRDIDTTLRRTRDGGWVPKATNSPVEFSGGSTAGRAARGVRRAAFTADETAESSPLVSLTSEGHTMTLSWPDPLPEPVVEDNRALYQEVFPGVDLLLTARDSGFSHVLIVKSREAAASSELTELTYGLSSPDLTFTIDPVTDAVSAKDADGTEIAVSPTPYMWDSAGEAEVTEGDDPEPDAPTDEPSPSYSEEPGAEVGEESVGPGLDTDAPTASAQPEATPPSPSASPIPTGDEETADPVAYHPQSTQVTVRQAAFRTAASATSDLTASEVLALPGLAGPQPGTHAAVATATLDHAEDSDGSGSSEATLHVIPDSGLLADDDVEFPLFIDPPFNGHTENWTTAYNRYPDSSFWSGINFNDGTSEARVGYESTTWGKSRSFFRLDWTPSLKGAHISSAAVYALETYSWSCDGRVVELWRTDAISSKTTWDNQPGWKEQVDSKDVAHGYNSSCPDDYVKFDAQDLAQDAADGGWSKITIGLKASDSAEADNSAYAWKKFKAVGEHAPWIKAYYNRKPKVPTSKTMSPGPDCDLTSPYTSVGRSDLTFAATSSDPDGNLKWLDFEVWHMTESDNKIFDDDVLTDVNGHASVKVLSSKFHNGYTYSWRVRAKDDAGGASDYGPTTKPGVCRFVYDGDKPNPPTITSTDFPAADTSGSIWSEVKFGTKGEFTFEPVVDTDVVQFDYSFNSSSYSEPVKVSAGDSATVSLSPPAAGPNVLYVRSVDAAGNPSTNGTKYLFYVTPRDTADVAGDVTGDATPDLFVIDEDGNLDLYPASSAGDLHVGLDAAHRDGTILAGSEDDDGYWKTSSGSPALIAHGGDILPGDGMTDLISRTPSGNLYAYPGDGYGSVNVAERMAVRLPSGAPDPAIFTQMILGDYNLDDRPDLFVTTAVGGLWAFTGYTGASFSTATQISASAWAERDLVSIGDHNADGEPDLLYRSTASGNLNLRYGIADSNGGSTLASLTTAAGSLTGADTTYATGWTASAMPMPLLYGTPDVTGDDIPDIWTLTSENSVKIYPGGAKALGSGTTVISSTSGWEAKLAFG